MILKCTICGEEKLTEDFKKDKRRPRGVGSWCKVCHNKKYNEYRLKNIDRIRARSRELYSENIEYKRAKAKKYRDRNRDHVTKYNKIYREKNRVVLDARSKKYYDENRDKVREYKRKWNKVNRETIKAKRKKHRSENYDFIKKKEQEYHNKNREQILFEQRKRRKNLTEGYIINLLRKDPNFCENELVPEIIDLKRNQVTMHRLLKEAKGDLRNGNDSI